MTFEDLALTSTGMFYSDLRDRERSASLSADTVTLLENEVTAHQLILRNVAANTLSDEQVTALIAQQASDAAAVDAILNPQ